MATILMNTLSGAVSEYDLAFQSLTPTHAGDAAGLFVLGGDTDAGLPIVATVVTGKQLWSGSLKKTAQAVYFSLKGGGTSTLTVAGEGASHSYPFPVLATGQSRSVPGKGLRENYLAFGYSNTDGAAFQLDRIEVLVAQSKNRRV